MTFIRRFMGMQNIIASILFAFYMHLIFFDGNFRFVKFIGIAPATINASYITHWVADVGGLYLVSQTAAYFIKPPGSVFFTYGTLLASVLPAMEILVFAAYLNDATPLQRDAWQIWLLTVIVDLFMNGIGDRLLQRSAFADVQRGGGGHH